MKRLFGFWGKNENKMGKFNFKERDFEKVKEEAEKFYKTIGEVYCPHFGDKITFNDKGGQKYFWSVIPFWGIDKETSKRILYSGNLEFD